MSFNNDTKITEFFLYYKLEKQGRELVSGNIWGTSAGRSFHFDLDTHKFFDFANAYHSGRGFKQLFELRNEAMPEAFRQNYEKIKKPKYTLEKKVCLDGPLGVIPSSLTPPNKLSFWDENEKRVDIPATSYCYKNALGQRVGYIMRGIDPKTGAKVVRPLSVWKRLLPNKKTILSYRQKKFMPVLYNFDLISTQLEKTVVVVEGEKCADFGMKCANQYGIPLVFTTWPFGAQSYKTDPSIWSSLKEESKRVVLWPDNDEIGHQAMREIKTLFLRSALMVKPARIGLREGEDIADLPVGEDLERIFRNIAG